MPRNPESIPDPSLTSPSTPDQAARTHGARQQELYEVVSRKIKIIQDLHGFIRSRSSEDPGRFAAAADAEFERIKASFGADVAARFDEISEMKQKSNELNDEILDLMDQIADEDSLDDYDNPLFDRQLMLQDELMELEDKIDGLSDDNTGFLRTADRFIQSMAEKQELASELQAIYQDDPVNFWNQIGAETGISPRSLEKAAVEVRFSGHCLNVILSEKAYKRLKPGSQGLHFPGTPINLIMQRDGLDSTIDHEEKHSLSESFISIPLYSRQLVESIKQSIETINRLTQLDSPPSLINHKFFRMESLIGNYFQANYAELVADFGKESRDAARSYLLQFIEAVDRMGEFIGQIDDAGIRTKLENYFSLMQQRFVHNCTILERIYSASAFHNKEEEAKMAILLFGPARFSKAERHCRHMIGEDRYEAATGLMRYSQQESYFKQMDSLRSIHSGRKLMSLILPDMFKDTPRPSDSLVIMLNKRNNDSDFYLPTNLRTLNSALARIAAEAGQDELTKYAALIDPGKLERKLIFESSYASDNHFNGWRELVDIHEELGKLAQLTRRPAFAKFVESRLAPQYASNLAVNKIKEGDDFNELKDFYNNWPLSKDLLETALLDVIRLRDVLYDYDEEKDEVSIDHSRIQSSPYWIFLRSVGLENQARQALAARIRAETESID